MKKKILPALSLFLASMCYADGDTNAAKEENATEITLTGNEQELAWIGPMHGARVGASTRGVSGSKGKNCKNQNSGAGMFNAAVRPWIQNGDAFIDADFLWWQAMENGLPYAISNNTQNTRTDGTVPNDLSNAHVQNLRSNWDPGFRVGIGYNFQNDGWDIALTGLWFVPTGKKHASTKSATQTLYATEMDPADVYGPDATLTTDTFDFEFGFYPSNYPFTQAKSRWVLDLYQLDLEMGREFYVGRRLTTRPFVGVRGNRIKQKVKTDYSGSPLANNASSLGINYPTQNVSVSLKNDFWGIGLAGGLDTQWKLSRDWSIYGGAAFAILYGWIDLHRSDTVEVDLTNPTSLKYNFVNLKNSYRDLRMILDIEAGFEWGHTFSSGKSRLSFHAGWEDHVYFDQNQFMYFTNFSSLGNFYVNQGNLNVQGFTFGGAVDF